MLLLWFAVAAIAVAQHTPWADEMQAWLLAGDVSWRALFTHSLHYEGTGGLWHALLKLLQACGVSFTGIRWLAAAIEGASMAVLLRYAPLPPLVRYLLPFTFFLLYQDGVVARSYCLFAILVFPAAVLLRGSRPRPLALAFLLGLLANLSVHGVIAAAGLAIAAAAAWRGRWLKNAPALAVLLVMFALAAATMAPARDIDYAAGNNLQRSLARIKKSVGLPVPTLPPPLTAMPMAGLQPAPPAVHIRHGAASVWNRLARILGVLTYPLSTLRTLALLLAVLVVVQASVRRKSAPRGQPGAWGLMPWLLMVVVFSSLYLAPRHVGTLFTAFIAAAWLTWPAGSHNRLLARATAGTLAAACLVQIGWTAHAIAAERHLPYAPGRMTAAFLHSHGAVTGTGPSQGLSIAGYYYLSIDPLLGFNRNIYFNQPPHRYWYWSTEMRNFSTAQQVLARHPRFIVVGGFDNGPDADITRDWTPVEPGYPGVVRNDVFSVVPFFRNHGYRVTHVFCGHSWMRSSYSEKLCDTVLEPTGASSETTKKP